MTASTWSAATLARCAGPAAFPALHSALLAKQGEWVPRAVDWQQANAERMQAQPQLAQLRALVDGSGLGAIAIASGMARPRIDACFATDANVKQTLTVSNGTAKVSGTPAFEINGRLVERVDWAKLQPMLVAAEHQMRTDMMKLATLPAVRRTRDARRLRRFGRRGRGTERARQFRRRRGSADRQDWTTQVRATAEGGYVMLGNPTRR
ncbi:DsbA family protein [Sphingomonas sp. MMS24-JH45]